MHIPQSQHHIPIENFPLSANTKRQSEVPTDSDPMVRKTAEMAQKLFELRSAFPNSDMILQTQDSSLQNLLSVEGAKFVRRFIQGEKILTGQPLDFMIKGNHGFFVIEDRITGLRLLSRNGKMQQNEEGFFVDEKGNYFLGRNIDCNTGKPSEIARLHIPSETMKGTPTKTIRVERMLDDSKEESVAGVNTRAYEVFSGGENFGKMKIAGIRSDSCRNMYGSYYYDNYNFCTDSAVVDPSRGVISLPSNGLIEAFRVGDTVSLIDSGIPDKRVVRRADIIAIDAAKNTVFVFPYRLSGFRSTNITIINQTNKSSFVGNSQGKYFNDILHSQVSMIDQNGNLVANFFRVASPPQGYDIAIATMRGGETIQVGTGEFTTLQELHSLIERALKDSALTHHDINTSLVTSCLDNQGQMVFKGSGLVSNFRLVVNQDNTEMRDYLGDLLYTGPVSATQALLDVNGCISNPVYLHMGARNKSRSDSTTKKLNEAMGRFDGTGYGEFAGLRFHSRNDNHNFGILTLRGINGLGITVCRDLKCIPRNPDPANDEFSTMGQLAELVDSHLKSRDFSTYATSTGKLFADTSASCTLQGGRLVFSSTFGNFNQLSLRPKNNSQDTDNEIFYSDMDNFGAVLGEIYYGVSGKQGYSNKFIEADFKVQAEANDGEDKYHNPVFYLVKDRRATFLNFRYKFKASLNPNDNTDVSANPSDKQSYIDTYNRIVDSTGNRGSISFASGGKISREASREDLDCKYGKIRVTPVNGFRNGFSLNSLDIAFDLSALALDRGMSNLRAEKQDGYFSGKLMVMRGDGWIGGIVAFYSNGAIVPVARLGFKYIKKPEGLERFEEPYFLQTKSSLGTDEVLTLHPQGENPSHLQIVDGALEDTKSTWWAS